ncbi:MAG: DNRLRE domain-containing protein [Candidatus Altiarchaeia archaeon]
MKKDVIWYLAAGILLSVLSAQDTFALQGTAYSDMSEKGCHQVSTWNTGGVKSSNYCCCYSPDQAGELRTGYFGHSWGTYTTRIYQRSTLRFPITQVPSGSTITSAKIYAYVSGVYSAQNLYLYSSTNDGWNQDNCNAGGVFANCPNCASSYDPGSLTYEGANYVAGPGWITWDVTNYLRNEYSGGQSYSTFHLRGASEAWTACSHNVNSAGFWWCMYHVVLGGPSSGNKPYLQMNYCYNNGKTCSANSDCCTGYCKQDYDGTGGWCAEPSQCVHNSVTYNNGAKAPDCCSPEQERYCKGGTWGCTACGTDTCSGVCGAGVNGCVWRDRFCSGGNCSSTDYDIDTEKARCDSCKGAGYWSLGGEVAGTICCGDDSREYKTARQCSSGCVTDPADDACCDAGRDCAYSSTCYSDGACRQDLKCLGGWWINHCINGVKDCDETGTDCGGTCPGCSETTSTTSPTTSTSTKTTSTTTTSATTTTSTTTTLRTVDVVFDYTPEDDNLVALCKLWTNMSGTWEVTDSNNSITSGINNYFNVDDVKEGSYAWNVQCFDSAGLSAYAYNAPQNWSFYVSD